MSRFSKFSFLILSYWPIPTKIKTIKPISRIIIFMIENYIFLSPILSKLHLIVESHLQICFMSSCFLEQKERHEKENDNKLSCRVLERTQKDHLKNDCLPPIRLFHRSRKQRMYAVGGRSAAPGARQCARGVQGFLPEVHSHERP